MDEFRKRVEAALSKASQVDEMMVSFTAVHGERATAGVQMLVVLAQMQGLAQRELPSPLREMHALMVDSVLEHFCDATDFTKVQQEAINNTVDKIMQRLVS